MQILLVISVSRRDRRRPLVRISGEVRESEERRALVTIRVATFVQNVDDVLAGVHRILSRE